MKFAGDSGRALTACDPVTGQRAMHVRHDVEAEPAALWSKGWKPATGRGGRPGTAGSLFVSFPRT